MSPFSRLRSALISALGPQGFQSVEQELFDQLVSNKQHILDLYHVGPQNPQERQELESGRATVNGKPMAVNADFAKHAVFVAQQLECSERYAAGLLHTVLVQNPNLSPIDLIELTLLEHYTYRRQFVDCLRYLFQAVFLSLSDGPNPLYHQLANYVRHQLITPASTANGHLTAKILTRIRSLDEQLSKIQIAVQNAGSNTQIHNGNVGLGHTILKACYDSVRYERRNSAIVYFQMARIGFLTPTDVQRTTDWLAANHKHPMTVYILSSLLAAFEPAAPDTNTNELRKRLSMDKGLVSYMRRKFDPANSEWKELGLKATVLLKWTLFLTDTRHRDPPLEHIDGFKTEELVTQIWNAVQGDSFVYLARIVTLVNKKRGGSNLSSFLASTIPNLEQDNTEPPTEDFKPLVLESFESLIRLLLTHGSSELRKIKQRQEDFLLASVRNDRSRYLRNGPNPPTATAPTAEAEKPRNDIATLLSFIGLLYSSLPQERALQFWGAAPREPITYAEYLEATSGKLPAFLQWVVWSTQPRDLDMTTALYDMLAGLTKGTQCSELGYNFLARGGGEVIAGNGLSQQSNSTAPTISLAFIFGILESWAVLSTSQAPPQQSANQYGWSSQPQPTQQPPRPQLSLAEKDVLLAQAFLRVLSSIAFHSIPARMAIAAHSKFRAIQNLLALVPLGIPLELKGALFNTIASFCEPGGGQPGVDLSKSVWSLMERLEIINVKSTGGTGVQMSKGVEIELEDVEAAHRLYPATIPFLKLLATLVHTQKRIPLKDQLSEAESINTIPDALGQPYRLPGIGPFVSFVVDNVFSKISSRDYAKPSDRWQTNDLCLCFIERCLASYPLESLVSPMEELQLKEDTLIPLLVHPGYDIMKRILSSTPLQTTLLTYIVDGIEGLDKGLAEEEYYFQTTMIRVLRIILRVLEIQDIFLDILVPSLSEFNSSSFIGTVHTRSYFTRLDQVLTFSAQTVPALVAYILYPQYPELPLLSVKILTCLASSPSVHNLTAIIDRSADSERILAGYQKAMDVEAFDNVLQAEMTTDQYTGAGAPDLEGPPEVLPQATRLAILDFLLANTSPDRPYPNTAHFLLFGGLTSDQQIQDPQALGSRRSCVHSILDLLNSGIPTLKGKGRTADSQAVPLFIILPGLAERCYRVVQRLCEHPRTADFSMRYLRTRENFFARHLRAIPFKTPSVQDDNPIEIVYKDETRVASTVEAISAFLRLRSSVFSLVALELHVLTNKGHNKGVTELLDLLFSHDDGYEDDEDEFSDEPYRTFQEVGQSNLRIIEYLHSLDFDWFDSLTVTPVQIEFLQLNLQACTQVDQYGSEIIDRNALLDLLTTARRTLHAKGRLVTPAHVDQLKAETNYILESCAVENHRRQVHDAMTKGYESWRNLLDMALVKCFDYLPQERRESMLYDLLHVLPNILKSPNIQQPTAMLLSEVLLSTITKLREDRQHQAIIQSDNGELDTASLPSERLYALLRSTLECVLDSSRNQFVRGNLYATLINYLHLITNGKKRSSDEPSPKQLSLSALSLSASKDDFAFGNGKQDALSTRQSSASLISGSAAIIRTVIEKLVATIARDAIDGTEVWKTVAFMLLDSLVYLCRTERQSSILTALTRHGILSNFVHGLKESDVRLQGVLKPDPDDLNALYVYETKMSLSIQISQTRQGAERLLESRVITILSQCDYLDARPEADQTFVDQSSLLPSASQRYHQLFIPSLQLVHGVLTTLGSSHQTATSQVLEFLNAHRDTIVILLRVDLDDIPLAVVDEINLVVSICTAVLPLVPKSELFSSSGYGGIHGAIFALAATTLGSSSWTESIRPSTDAELADATAYDPVNRHETKFRSNVQRKEMMLRRSMSAYLGSASSFAEPEISLVLSPVIAAPRHEERGVRFYATVPSVGDAIEALNDLCTCLTTAFKNILDLSAELAARDSIRVDSVTQIFDAGTMKVMQDLDIAQKRALVAKKIQSLRSEARYNAQSLLDTLEILLLLLWRHLQYYTEARPAESQIQVSTPHITRLVTSMDVESFRAEVPRRLGALLQRLDTLDMNNESLAENGDWRFNRAYIETICRRIRETTGLQEPENDGQGQF